jgi:predicted phage terminase large subunit-like protein
MGVIFPRANVQHYKRADLPKVFQRKIMSVDATFKDGAASDFVAVGVWGKTADEKVWLIDYRRERLAFMATAQAIADLKNKHPQVGRIYIEKAANGEALIDMLHKHFPQIEGVLPLGSKEARAHAVSWVWSANNVMLPSPDESPGIAPWVAEITSFPDVKNDDTVDCMTIALQQLCLRSPIAALITRDILNKA